MMTRGGLQQLQRVFVISLIWIVGSANLSGCVNNLRHVRPVEPVGHKKLQASVTVDNWVIVPRLGTTLAYGISEEFDIAGYGGVSLEEIYMGGAGRWHLTSALSGMVGVKWQRRWIVADRNTDALPVLWFPHERSTLASNIRLICFPQAQTDQNHLFFGLDAVLALSSHGFGYLGSDVGLVLGLIGPKNSQFEVTLPVLPHHHEFGWLFQQGFEAWILGNAHAAIVFTF